MELNKIQSDELDTKMIGGSNRLTNSGGSSEMFTQNVGFEDDDTYSTAHKRRGIAIVINQVNFKGMKKREGSNKDRDCICAALEKLQFLVRLLDDLSRDEMFSELRLIADKDHSENDCLVVVVMTHGSENVLYASDTTYEVNELLAVFLGNKCPSLLGKPKLFFIQACRGEKFDEGVQIQIRRSIVTDTVDAQHMHQPSERLLYVIPTTCDLLVMYSTYEGHYSFRNPTNGSWFIQSLSDELNKNGTRKELLRLLTGVSRRVAFEYQSFVPYDATMDAMKQMPCIVTMLIKAFYFPPKQDTLA